jgi:cell division protease FtsH
MSEDLGPVAWNGDDSEIFLGRQMTQVKSYSEATARRIDEEVRTIVQRGYDAARSMLASNVHVLHAVAEALIDRETLDGEEFEALVERSGPVRPQGLAWLGV